MYNCDDDLSSYFLYAGILFTKDFRFLANSLISTKIQKAIFLSTSSMLISMRMKAGWQWIFSLNLQVQTTEQMTQNWTFYSPRIIESAKSCLSDMYVVVISCFHSISQMKT